MDKLDFSVAGEIPESCKEELLKTNYRFAVNLHRYKHNSIKHLDIYTYMVAALGLLMIYTSF
jgi:hypothetical protein